MTGYKKITSKAQQITRIFFIMTSTSFHASLLKFCAFPTELNAYNGSIIPVSNLDQPSFIKKLRSLHFAIWKLILLVTGVIIYPIEEIGVERSVSKIQIKTNKHIRISGELQINCTLLFCILPVTQPHMDAKNEKMLIIG